MNSNFTHLSLCLDRSGSMQSIRNDTINGFNRLIQDQQAVPGECTVTLVQFDSQGIDTVFNAKPVRTVPPLTNETYVPRGGTPLYDAIAHTINATGKFLKDMPAEERPAKIIFVIITDGEENQSREFDQAKVFSLITHQRDVYKWEFVFIGANQDAFAVGGALGVNAANCMTNVANVKGTSATYGAVSSNMLRMREAPVGTSACGMSFSTDQYAEQEKAARK